MIRVGDGDFSVAGTYEDLLTDLSMIMHIFIHEVGVEVSDIEMCLNVAKIPRDELGERPKKDDMNAMLKDLFFGEGD